MPRFSVLMPNYNKGPYIDEAINSVLAQTFTDWELVIVDDASTDDSLRRVEKYLGDPRIRLYMKEGNEGISKTFIYGLTKVASGIVGVLDSDDALAQEAIEKVYAVHTQNPDAGVVLTQTFYCDAALHPLDTSITTIEDTKAPLLWMKGSTHFRTFKMAAYRRTAGVDINLRLAVDWDLLFKLEEVAPAHRINEPLYFHRHLGSSTFRIGRHVGFRSIALAAYRAQVRRHGTDMPALPQASLSSMLVAAIRYSIELDEPREALTFALRGLRIAPRESACYRGLARALRFFVSRLASDTAHAKGCRFYPACELQSATGAIEPDRVVCRPHVHQEGHCVYGGDYLFATGAYTARFELTVVPLADSHDPLAKIDIYENRKLRRVLAELQITAADIKSGKLFSVDFFGEEGQRVEFRVFWTGQCVLKAYGVFLEFLRTEPERRARAGAARLMKSGGNTAAKVAIFASSDDKYVPKAVVALRSFQRWYPNYGYFLLATEERVRRENIELLKTHGVELIDVDESSRLIRKGAFRDKYPIEALYKLKGPELLAERGFDYSIAIDGDVFCYQPPPIDTMLAEVNGYAGRIVGTLERTLGFKQDEKNPEFDFSSKQIWERLGLDQHQLRGRYEINNGFIVWNNAAMAEKRFYARAIDVFNQCEGCFEGDQDWLSLAAAACRLPLLELGDPYNFTFFEDSISEDRDLREDIDRGRYDKIFVAHFLRPKPWEHTQALAGSRAHFIDAWRQFVRSSRCADCFPELA